jgi:hypothetical protein
MCASCRAVDAAGAGGISAAYLSRLKKDAVKRRPVLARYLRPSQQTSSPMPEHTAPPTLTPCVTGFRAATGFWARLRA